MPIPIRAGGSAPDASTVYTLAAAQGRDAIRDPLEDGIDLDNEETNENDSDLGDEDNDETDNGTVALDALEAEELETVETNESATILVDEASEIMAIRREEVAFDASAQSRRGDEFVCRSCFLLLKNVQLADRQNMLCFDCA